VTSRVRISLKDIFYPQSIAVIGASSDEQKERNSWTGVLLNFGYQGKLYPVNPKATKILGLQTYPSVKDIPRPIDYAILNIPAPLVPGVLQDCATKGVKVCHIFTSGFAETGMAQGVKLQEEVQSIVNRTGICVIGPNCLGIHCPDSRITFANLPRKGGPAAFISQTGAGAGRAIIYGCNKGIYFGKVISYGNAVDLDSSDLLEILAEDPKTKYIGLYIEGTKNGRRFFEATKKCLRMGKVMVILKSGLTEAARETVASHTGALGGSEQAWQAFFAQTGAIRVHTLEEIVHQLVAFQYIAQPKGRRVGIIGRGGGPGVIATEICEMEGLKVPAYNEKTREQLRNIIAEKAGSMVRNPVEIGVGWAGTQAGYKDAFKIVADSNEVDLILTHLNPEAFALYGGTPEWLNDSIDTLLQIYGTLPIPVVLVLPNGETRETRALVEHARRRCSRAGLAVFTTYESATRAISKLITYYESSHKFQDFEQ